MPRWSRENDQITMPNIAKQLKIVYRDIERQVIDDGKKITEVIDAKTQAQIINQVNEEYELAFKFNEAKRTTLLRRLQLYNNQKKDLDAVGDQLMFTVFNTIHSALYDDKLMTAWEGRGGEGDEDVEENLNYLSEFDYDVMKKAELDYFWDWDAEFTGRGRVLMMDFDRSPAIKAPVPELIDAFAWIRDPQATSVNGDMRGKGG